MVQVFHKIVRSGIPYLRPEFNPNKVDQLYANFSNEKELKTSALKDKMVEEALEVQKAPNRANLVEEMGDVLQAILDLCETQDISFGEVEDARVAKFEKYGGFLEGYYLVSIKP